MSARFTPEEQDIIKACRKQKMRYSEIARLIKRTAVGVRYHCLYVIGRKRKKYSLSSRDEKKLNEACARIARHFEVGGGIKEWRRA